MSQCAGRNSAFKVLFVETGDLYQMGPQMGVWGLAYENLWATMMYLGGTRVSIPSQTCASGVHLWPHDCICTGPAPCKLAYAVEVWFVQHPSTRLADRAEFSEDLSAQPASSCISTYQLHTAVHGRVLVFSTSHRSIIKHPTAGSSCQGSFACSLCRIQCLATIRSINKWVPMLTSQCLSSTCIAHHTLASLCKHLRSAMQEMVSFAAWLGTTS